MSEIPDGEDLFRFVHFNDYEDPPDAQPRLRSSLYSTSYPVSMNRGSIWPLERQLEVAPPLYGLCSLPAGEFRRCGNPDRGALDVLPDPIDAPHVDPLLGIPNPSHASATRRLTDGESRRAAKEATKNIHRVP